MNPEAALDSSDPKQRFLAVKHAARNKNKRLLKKLTQMAQNDPDEQVRAVATRAVAYIQADGHGGTGRKQKEVTPRDVARAKAFLDAAVSYQFNGDRDRALKELAKALDANPKLEYDQFYKSVLEDVTGAVSEDALEMVRDPQQLKAMASGERKLKREKRKQEHMDTVRRSTWGSVLMDLLIYVMINTVAVVLLVLLVGQVSQNYIAGIEEQQQAYARGEIDEPPEVDRDIEEFAEQFSGGLGVTVGLLAGAGSAIGSVISLLINLLFTHLAARFLFGGHATFPHLIYKVVSFYNGRLPVLYGLLFVVTVLTFTMGSGIIFLIGMLLLGLFSLYLFFQTIGRIGEAYDFGTGKGCLSFLVGTIVLSVISFVIQLMFYGSIAAMIASQLELS